MSSALSALGRWAFRARRLVVLLWVAVLAVLFVAAGLLGTGTDNTYKIPGTESQDALDSLARTFPQFSGSSAQLVAVAPDGGDVTAPDFEAAVEAAVAAITDIPQVSGASSPYGASTANLSADHSAALVPVQLSVGTTSVLPATSDALQQAGVDLEESLPAGSQVAVGGQLFAQSAAGISVTELVGIAVAFVVLLVTFGAFAAAGMPLVTALVGAAASLAIVFVATGFTTITSTTPLLALMLGLAVGIDYALFILARHQDQLKQGLDPEESASRSVATAGSAVVFAATTVIIALLGLSVAGIPFLTTMGLAAALAVTIAVVVSMTLTPALLGFAGWRVAPKRYRPGAPQAEDDGEDVAEAPRGGFFLGWVRAVTRWPVVTVVGVVLVLGALAVPAAGLRLALPDAGALDEDEPARITYDLIAEHFGPGYNGPLVVTGSVIQSTDPVGLVNDVAAEIAKVPGVASVPLATPNESGDTAVIQVVPEGSPDSEATEDLVAALRAMHDQLQEEYQVDLSVTGYTAAGIDISARLADALLPFGLIIVGLSLALLAMVFRSIVVPVTAALGYVLSIAAAFGLTALVFVDGFLAGPLNVASVGSVVSFMPIILMGVLFGLAMDYEVFLVSRMREHYVHHGDPEEAIEQGFLSSARVVTAAAIIMVAVFAAFIPEGDANIQPIAFGLAVGVAIDAFVVRMTFIPAVLALFGARAWWFPRWLDRVLPHVDVEGEGLAKELVLQDWPAEPGIALAADGMRVGSSDGIDLLVPVGDVLVVRGGSEADRRAVLLGLAGRHPVTDGHVKVVGLVLPQRAASVRRVTSYVDLELSPDPVADLRAAVHGTVRVLFVAGVDTLADPATRGAVRDTLAEGERTLVLACRPDADLDDVLPFARTLQVLDLPTVLTVA